MTQAVFFWYVLPFLIAAACFGWLAYERLRPPPDRLHPGE